MHLDKEVPFINRYNILRFFSQDIASNTDTTVSIIYSKSGIGKSRLCEEILKDVKHIQTKVKVKINISKANYLQDGYYIKQLAKVLHENSYASTSSSFEDFLQIDAEEDVNQFLYNIANDYIDKNPIFKNTKEVISKFFTFGNFDTNKVFDSNLSDSMNMLYKYINYVCQKNYFIINFENIQNIDSTSLELLSKLLQDTKYIYLLLEYTISQQQHALSLEDIQNNIKIKPNINFNIKELEQLNENDLIKLLESNNELLKKYIENSYKQWDGNLRPFINLHYNLPDNNEEIKNFISNKNNAINYIVINDILNLKSKEQFLLILIATHADSVDVSLMNQLHNIDTFSEISTIFDFELELNKLVDKRFLNVYNKSYLINDDTILDCLLNNSVFQSKKILALQLWLQIHSLIYNGDNHYFTSKSSLLYKILSFSVQLEEEQNILKHLNELMFLFKNSTPIWVKDWIYKILDSIKDSKNNYINNLIKIRLSEITQNLALYDISYSLINSINSDKINILLTKAILLENNSKPSETLQILNLIYTYPDLNDRAYLLSRVTEISALRSLNEYKKAKKTFEELLNNKKYINYLEYGFILRHAGTIYDANKALPYVIQGIEHFKKYTAPLQELHSRIELSVMYIYNNDFEKARKELTIASQLSQKQFIENYIITNNLAIVNLYQNQNLEDTYIMLKRSLSNVQTPFDKLAIYINLLISAVCLKLDEEIILNLCNTIDELCLLNNIADKEVKRIAYLDLMLSCKLLENIEKFELYKTRFINIHVDGNKYGITDEFNLLVKDKLDYKNQKNCVGKFITCELSHWTIEFDNILNNFE